MATLLFSIEALSCSSRSFLISLFLRMSIVISSSFRQHSRTARTMFPIVYELSSQLSRFRSTEDSERSFSKQLAR